MGSHRRLRPSITASISFYCQLLIVVYIELLLEILKYESWKTYRAAKWPWRRIIAVFYLRATHGLSISRRDVQPITTEAIRSACSKRRLLWPPHLIRCEQWPRAILHEIGYHSHSQGPVFLYFHGGGYVSSLHEATHMPLVFKFGGALNGDTGRTFVLEYGLAPGLKYPGQLVQSACALNYLLTELGCELEQIVIGGDGSGGNLALALPMHINQPHPFVPKSSATPGATD